ncbi:MAG TPA: hypothetical protein PLQ09_08820, partial [Prolixibacteraceae bacterium]|nr:hypothetical protein [Prolixibacteraceae bacterium]
MKRIIIQIALLIGAIILAYLIWDSIRTPLDFGKEKDVRYSQVIENLKDIRKAEIAYKDVYGRFCGDWDSLVNFVKYDSIPKIRKIGMLTDSMIAEGLDEKAALKKGLIIRDTIKVSVITEIFTKDYPIEKIGIIPNTNNDKFWLGQAIVTTGSGVNVPVFEARAHNNQILSELMNDYKQEIINLNEQSRKNNKYPGLKVGSITEPNNNAGNWE